jgi:hypothetical protein
MNTKIYSCSLSDLNNLFLYLLLGFLDNFLYPGRMNAAVSYKLV